MSKQIPITQSTTTNHKFDLEERTLEFAKRDYTKEYISKASHPHPCPLPSRERGLKNRPSLDGRGLRGGYLNVSLLMNCLVRLCKQLPQTVINKEIVAQLIRASGSVGANYREANDSLSKKDFIYRIKISRKEAKGSHYGLELLQEANPEYNLAISNLLTEVVELRKIFSAIADKCS